ncbi:hypothetical protein [Nocardia bovistercoris]|uniref:Uncharacterized protein n=1 Tax=Nocardia bovistercoris TaxID=2785916 RepID=A0A931I9G4_9NOCA|nr:hypothetical protein [Nocardia bovistercoris]MBH0775788.1 hypothetical protein [Nocardia bovistercoris]
MNTAPEDTSPRPQEPDVHLSIFLHGIRFDFIACDTAARAFVRDHNRRSHVDAASIEPLAAGATHPRLPNERLYLDPPPDYHTTRLDGAEARWFAREGVVRVVSVTDASGYTVPLHGFDLGACIDHMPRKLWHLVRRRHEAIEDEMRGRLVSSVETLFEELIRRTPVRTDRRPTAVVSV